MTAVHSNLGDGQVFSEAHFTEHDTIDATLSTPNLTTSWIAMDPGGAEALAAALAELVDQLDIAVKEAYAATGATS